MKKIILGLVLSSVSIVHANPSLGSTIIQKQVTNIPPKVQQSYDMVVSDVTTSLFQLGAMPFISLDAMSRGSNGSYIFSMFVSDGNGVIQPQYAFTEIRPNGEIIAWPAIAVPF